MSRRTIPPLATTKELAEAGVTRIVVAEGSLARPAGSVMTTREHDLAVALDRLCKATRGQLNTNGVESVGVGAARRNAEKLLHDYRYSPNETGQR